MREIILDLIRCPVDKKPLKLEATDIEADEVLRKKGHSALTVLRKLSEDQTQIS